MTLDPLATTADLLDQGFSINDTGKDPLVALRAASAAVRDAAGCVISQVTSTISLPAPSGRWLDLPAGPVASVATVLVDSVAVSGWRLIEDRLWRDCGWWAGWYPALATVTYTHGLAAVPDDIVQLVCDLAIADLLTDTPHDPRVVSEAIDDSRTGWQPDSGVSVFELPERTRLMLARRFGGGAYVTGSR